MPAPERSSASSSSSDVASVDLLFSGAPLLTGDLVFGDDGSSTISDAVLSGTVVLARPSPAGRVALGIVASGTVALVRPSLSGALVYRTDTQRPLVADVQVRFQDAVSQPEAVEQRWQDTTAAPLWSEQRWQDAVHAFESSQIRWVDSDRSKRRALAVRYQDGDRQHIGATPRFQSAARMPNTNRQRYEDALPRRTGKWFRYQEAIRGIAGQQRMRYQDADALQAFVESIVGSGRAVHRGWSTRYQEGVQPRPGRTIFHPVEPPVGEPCYTPSGDLVFEMPWSADTNLVFVCDAHGGGPDPEPGDTVVVPIRRIYTVINSASLRRVDGDVLIPNTAMSLTIDVDSWTWGFTARVPGAALDDLQPSGGVPVELEAKINGVAYRAIVEGISRERVFGRSDLTVTGRGRNAVLDAPYAPVMTFGNAQARTVQQLANDVLSFNGVPLGWDVDAGWQPEDWLVPAGVFSHQGTYISALNAIAADAGAYVQPHRTAKALQVLQRYPAKPWEWDDVTPDFELPSAVVQKEGTVWTNKPNYNRVFVRGMKSGVLGQITRAGTAGDIEAPMVTAQLATNAIGARQRGLPVLADTGRQAAVSLRLPVLAETGIIPPGKFVRYVDAGVPRIGLVRSVAAETARADDRLTVWQTIGVETHV